MAAESIDAESTYSVLPSAGRDEARLQLVMPTFEIISLVLLGALAWLWFDSIHVRGIGIGVARAACAAEGMQLLDDTVSISSLKLARDDDGRVLLRRVYSFDYSDTGDNRRGGSVVMLGPHVLIINVGLHLASSNPPLH